MKKMEEIKMPYHYTAIADKEMECVDGGAVTTGGLLNFISYLLSGLSINSAVEVLQTLVIALGAGLGVWGGVNLLEGYGNDNPGAKSQGMKHLMAK